MSDHEFEKKVQLRMDDLRLTPSDAVWAEVEKNLRGEKRRRRMLLWLPLLGLLLTGGAYLLFSGSSSGHDEVVATNQPAEKTVVPGKTGETVTTPATDATHLSTSKNTDQTLSKNSTPSATDNKTITISPAPAATAEKIVGQKKIKQPLHQKSKNNSYLKTESHQEPVLPSKEPAPKRVVLKTDSAKTQVDSNAIAYNSLDPTKVTLFESIPAANIDIDMKGRAAIVTAAPKIKYPNPSSKWQWGVKAGGGVSNISEGSLFDVLHAVRVEDLTAAGPQYNGFPAAPAPEPSAIDPGIVLSAGGFVQRTISKRISISLGLQYAYWTVNTLVGNKVDNARAINYGNLNSQLVSQYYRADMDLKDYVNKYHFIELPLSASYRLNKSKRIPLVIDAGVSFARLMNTNALHFDGISRVYYENDDFFKKMQVGLNGSFNIGFLQNTKHPLFVGPNLRYYATGLLKEEVGSSGSQHLWSFGLNAKMLLKK